MTGEQRAILGELKQALSQRERETMAIIMVLGPQMEGAALSGDDVTVFKDACNLYHHLLMVNFIVALLVQLDGLTAQVASQAGEIAKLKGEM
jgi:hypothetical protein